MNDDIEWYRGQWRRYSDLKEELERVSGLIDVQNLQNEVNRIIALLYSAKDKIELIDNKHRNRQLVGVK